MRWAYATKTVTMLGTVNSQARPGGQPYARTGRCSWQSVSWAGVWEIGPDGITEMGGSVVADSWTSEVFMLTESDYQNYVSSGALGRVAVMGPGPQFLPAPSGSTLPVRRNVNTAAWNDGHDALVAEWPEGGPQEGYLFPPD